MDAIREAKPEPGRQAIDSAQSTLETLNVARAVALEKKNDETVELLKYAGATPPPEIALETLQSYAGNYRCAHGPEVEILVEEGKLFARPGNQELVTLWPLDQTRFKPAAFDGAMVVFHITGLTFVQDGHETNFEKL